MVKATYSTIECGRLSRTLADRAGLGRMAASDLFQIKVHLGILNRSF